MTPLRAIRNHFIGTSFRTPKFHPSLLTDNIAKRIRLRRLPKKVYSTVITKSSYNRLNALRKIGDPIAFEPLAKALKTDLTFAGYAVTLLKPLENLMISEASNH